MCGFGEFNLIRFHWKKYWDCTEEIIHAFIQQINLEMFIQFLLLIKVLFVGDNVLNEIRYEEMIKLLTEIENSESPLLRSWYLSQYLKGLWVYKHDNSQGFPLWERCWTGKSKWKNYMCDWLPHQGENESRYKEKSCLYGKFQLS